MSEPRWQTAKLYLLPENSCLPFLTFLIKFCLGKKVICRMHKLSASRIIGSFRWLHIWEYYSKEMFGCFTLFPLLFRNQFWETNKQIMMLRLKSLLLEQFSSILRRVSLSFNLKIMYMSERFSHKILCVYIYIYICVNFIFLAFLSLKGFDWIFFLGFQEISGYNIDYCHNGIRRLVVRVE